MLTNTKSRWARSAAMAVLAFPLALLGATSGQAQTPSPSRQTVSLSVGESTTIVLSENPSTGYEWRLDTAQSASLGIVRVTDGGYSTGESGLLGAPGSHRWRILARAPGTARVVFTYSRPWQRDAPAQTEVVEVTVTRRR